MSTETELELLECIEKTLNTALEMLQQSTKSRPLALAITKLEEAGFWLSVHNKEIKNHGYS